MTKLVKECKDVRESIGKLKAGCVINQEKFLKIWITCFWGCVLNPSVDWETWGVCVTEMPQIAQQAEPPPKHKFCWGWLWPAVALLPELPLTASHWQQSLDPGGTGWLGARAPGILYLHWCSAKKKNEDRKGKNKLTGLLLSFNKCKKQFYSLSLQLFELNFELNVEPGART